MTDEASSASAPVKSGWRTSEFWLKLAAFTLTALYASGVIPTSGTAAQVAAIVATILGSLGYTVMRTLAKQGAVLMLVTIWTAGLMMQACAWMQGEAKVAKAAIVDCTTATAKQAVHEFSPIVDALLMQATAPDGKVNWTPIEQLGKSLGVQLGGCVLATVVAHELEPPAPDPSAPKSAPLELDAASLRAGWEQMRARQFAGARFETAYGSL